MLESVSVCETPMSPSPSVKEKTMRRESEPVGCKNLLKVKTGSTGKVGCGLHPKKSNPNKTKKKITLINFIAIILDVPSKVFIFSSKSNGKITLLQVEELTP